MTTLCKVNGCKFSNDHVTCFHQCGNCHLLGHGQIECSAEYILVTKLSAYDLERVPIPMQCTRVGCEYHEYHTTKGHCCAFCGTRNDKHMNHCPTTTGTHFIEKYISDEGADDYNDFLDNLMKDNNVKDLQNGTYAAFGAGMGCTLYVRNNNGVIEYFFMHSDSWGQYGKDTSEVPCVNAFKLGYLTQ